MMPYRNQWCVLKLKMEDPIPSGVQWTEEEHQSFLAGTEKLGKGDWKGITKSFVTTKTLAQVASHAVKYFLRHAAADKKKRRTSIFDISINESHSPNSVTFSKRKLLHFLTR